MKTTKIVIASLVSLTMVSNPLLTFAATNDVIDNTTEITTDKETSSTQPTIKTHSKPVKHKVLTTGFLMTILLQR